MVSAVDDRDRGPASRRKGGWIMVQPWYDVLFAHWPMPAEALRPRLPAGLELDTYDGRAWLGVLALQMRGIRPRGLPPLPLLSSLAQVNVRTYVVSRRGGPGVLFFGLYAGSLLASLGARIVFSLPYHTADVSVRPGRNRVRLDCRAWQTDPVRAVLRAVYRPVSDPFQPAEGTLEHWFTERYRLYTVGPGGHLYHGDIAHEPWSLQPAELTIAENSLAAAHGLPAPAVEPVAYYSRGRETRVWPLQRL
jgi:uncharacterized protein YqjF (DUF2071 family)